MRPPLTDDQVAAAVCDDERLFLEAAPGSGKTTVAAERYGVLRFSSDRRADGPVVAVSFTRSATAELRTRVARRWGAGASSWPDRIETIDTFMRRLLEYLLRAGVLYWPGGHVELDVVDDWHGHAGFRPLQTNAWCRSIEVLADGTIRTKALRLNEPEWGFSTVNGINPLLEAGLTTPREIRGALEGAFAFPAFRATTKKYLGATTGHLLVDEVFDANALDLRLVHAACLAEVPVTLIGDPWQALYGWRGAEPEEVQPLLDARGFAKRELVQSFRFLSPLTTQLAASLRSGQPVAVEPCDTYDVALARKWRSLWELPSDVLPLSFGRPRNKTQAALALLLDVVTTTRLGQHALFLREAVLILGIDQDQFDAEGGLVLAPLVDKLRAGAQPADVLDDLRDGVVVLGAAQRPPAVAANEEDHERDLADLATRLGDGDVVPGLTVFQAKGREWDSVGVGIPDDDAEYLAAGLSHLNDRHRVLYVALTRARHEVGAVRG